MLNYDSSIYAVPWEWGSFVLEAAKSTTITMDDRIHHPCSGPHNSVLGGTHGLKYVAVRVVVESSATLLAAVIFAC